MNAEDLKMGDDSSFIEYLECSYTSAETKAWTEWTQGYEACRRRLAEVLLPQIEAHKPKGTKP